MLARIEERLLTRLGKEKNAMLCIISGIDLETVTRVGALFMYVPELSDCKPAHLLCGSLAL